MFPALSIHYYLSVAAWFVYLLRTAGNSIYTGITTDVGRRLKEHGSGKGAKALRGKGPLTLLLKERIGSRSKALKIEYRIKRLSRKEKEELVLNPKLKGRFKR